MTIDNRTLHHDWPRPNPNNSMLVDVQRIDAAVQAIDAEMATKLTADELPPVAVTGSYNDLDDKPAIPGPYTLPPATTSTLGGVKVGQNLTMAPDGTLNASGGGTAYSREVINPTSAGQTVFTVPGGYTVGAIAVLRNGVDITEACTATNGTSITTPSGLTLAEQLVISRLSVFSVADAVPQSRTVNGKSLTGDIALTPADVGAQSALGFTPLNKAGDTLAGGLKMAVVAKGSISGAQTFDLGAADVFTATITGATTISFSNAPGAGASQCAVLRLTNAGSAVITWPTGTKFEGGVAPALTAAGVDVLTVFYDPVDSKYAVFVRKDVK